MLCAACTLILVGIGTSVRADSSHFAGPYIAIQAGPAGLAIDGAQNGGADAVTGNTTASAGAAVIVAGAEVGYAIPIGASFVLDIGASIIDGAASVRTETTDTAADPNVKAVVSDFVTYYVAPTIVLSDTASLYFKYGATSANVRVVGDVNDPGGIHGTVMAVGTRTVLPSGIFIRAEAGYTDYDNITTQGKGNDIAATTKYHADPEVAYGMISLGFRF